jgi:hypothetical protein
MLGEKKETGVIEAREENKEERFEGEEIGSIIRKMTKQFRRNSAVHLFPEKKIYIPITVE